MFLNPTELDNIRAFADLGLAIGVPLMVRWAVNKHLIQQRWGTMIDAAAGAGLAAGKAAGPIESTAFRVAAEAAVLSYAKTQAADVLVSKGMTDDLTVEAGMARVATMTGGAVGPNGSVAAASPAP